MNTGSDDATMRKNINAHIQKKRTAISIVTCQIYWLRTYSIRIWNAIQAQLAIAVQTPALDTAASDTGVVFP
jgi:hypothetical protein